VAAAGRSVPRLGAPDVRRARPFVPLLRFEADRKLQSSNLRLRFGARFAAWRRLAQARVLRPETRLVLISGEARVAGLTPSPAAGAPSDSGVNSEDAPGGPVRRRIQPETAPRRRFPIVISYHQPRLHTPVAEYCFATNPAHSARVLLGTGFRARREAKLGPCGSGLAAFQSPGLVFGLTRGLLPAASPA
jgi:hypothetical protein